MDKKKITASKGQASTYTWKKRPSELGGFQHTFYLTDDNKDYLRVDYSIKEKRIRLYVEVFKEGGSPYFSIINKGHIGVEKSILTGRNQGFSDVFSSRASIFSTIPSDDVVKLIAGNYGIRTLQQKSENQLTEREKRLEETKRRYFVEIRSRDNSAYSTGANAGRTSSFSPVISDIFDLLTGIIISLGLFYILEYNFLAMGIFAGFFGLAIGIIDFFIRKARPNLMKILFFFAAGTASYIYGYYVV